MFQYSVVSEAELLAYKQRTAQALSADKPSDSRMRAIIKAFNEWPHIATVWAFAGEVRKEGDKLRTRRHHMLTFVVTEKGLVDVDRIMAGWQEHELGKRMQVTMVHQHLEGDADSYYPAWIFRLNYRPDPEVLDSVMKHWLALAIFTERDH